jgi:hypothetical protein
MHTINDRNDSNVTLDLLTTNIQLLELLDKCTVQRDDDAIIIDCPTDDWPAMLELLDWFNPPPNCCASLGFCRNHDWQFSFPIETWS